MVDSITPLTEATPAHAPKAEDVAVVVDLPSRKNSADTFDGFKLEQIDPSSQVHPAHEVIRDRKTGKHYKKVTPAWSLAHAKAQQSGSSSNASKSHHNPKFSLAHSFGDKERDPGSVGSGVKSGSRTPPQGGGHLSAADIHTLVEQLRTVVRDEVSIANRGHQKHLEKVVNEAIPDEGLAYTAPTLRGGQVPGSDTSEDSHKGGTRASVLDPKEAARGVASDADSDASVYEFPNPWAKIRYQCREPFAEFLGCVILMTFGDGINIQALFAAIVDPSSPKGDYLSVSFGWGIAVAMAVYVCGGVSGHINPAVTLSLALFRGFPWKKVPVYIFAQISGATLGALMIYGLYVNPIKMVDPNQTEVSAQFFTTFPATFIRTQSTRITGFYNEVYASAILLIVILAINDGSNSPPPDGMAPIVLLWLITGIGATLGWQTAYAVNPARDLGPRIALSIVGYRGLWSFNAWYWAYTPLLGPIVGGPLGCFIYDAMIYTGSESPLNKPWKWSNVRWKPASRKKMPAALGDINA